MYRHKNNIIYVDFLFKRKKIKSKPIILLYSFYTRLSRTVLRPIIEAFSKKSDVSMKRKSSGY